METSSKTARQLFQELKDRNYGGRQLGFGARPALLNIDLQNCYTRAGEFSSAYETDPAQLEQTNRLAAAFRARGLPVVWTYIAYSHPGRDTGVWSVKVTSLLETATGSRRAALDERLHIDLAQDFIVQKRMASAFHETHVGSLLAHHKVDTVVVTGGSTSGCVRATVVDAVSRGLRPIVAEECVADRHESPHFGSLYDMAQKYADVLPVREVLASIGRYPVL